MKRFLFLFFASLLPLATWAYDFSDDSSGTTIYYGYCDGGVEVTWGGEKNTSGTESYTGDITVPSSVNDGSSDYTVVSVGERAFDSCSNLTSVTFPETLTKISDYAFRQCTALTSVELSGAKITSIGSYGFYGCNKLKDIVIPETVTEIGAECFYGATSIESVTLPSGLTSIPTDAFYSCTSLKYVEFSDGITEIGKAAFRSCTALEEIVLPRELITLGENVFYTCSGLKNVVIYDKCTSIGNYGFYSCKALETIWSYATTPPSVSSKTFSSVNSSCIVYVPEESVSAYQSASYWSALTIMAMPEDEGGDDSPLADGDKFEVDGIFYDVISSANETVEVTYDLGYDDDEDKYIATYSGELTIPETVTYKGVTYTVIGIGANAFNECRELTSVVLPETITSIGRCAFYECRTLATLNIPEGVTSIGDFGFYNCRAITSLVIPDGVTKIGESMFYNCQKLVDVTLGNAVESIGSMAFSGCSVFTTLYCYSANPPTCNNAFYLVTLSSKTLYVPCDSRTTYAEADTWSGFGTILGLDCPPEPLEDGTVFEYGGLNYQVVSSESRTIETTYSGEKNTTATTYAGDIEIPATVTYENVTYTVVGVGDYTFYNAKTAITTVSIPETVTRIGNRAFYYCNTIPQLTLPSGLTTIDEYAFDYCNKITTFNIPSTVTSIGASAFRECSALTSIELPDGLTEISEYMFYNCTALKTIKVPETITSIGGYVFYKCSVLEGFDFPSGVTSIGSYAFYQCKAITSMELPSAVTALPSNLCYQCTALEEVVLSEKTVDTGENSFYGCTALKKVTYKDAPASDLALQLPESCTTIGYYSFRQCAFEGELIIPATVTSLTSGAFYNCSSITSVTIEASATPLLNVRASGANCSPFYQCSSLETVKLYRDCYNGSSLGGTTHEYGIFREVYRTSAKGTLKNVYFGGELTEVPQYGFYTDQLIDNIVFEEGNKVTSIGCYAFYQCKGLTSIDIPDGVNLIDGYAFYQNTALEEITFGEESTLATINNYALYGNTALTELVLPATLQNVGGNAFNNCTKLLSVTSLNPTPPTCDGVNTFSSTTTSTGVLYVPCGSEEAYSKIDDWCDFETIVGIDCQDEPLADGDTFVYDGIIYKVISAEDQTVEVTYYGDSYSADDAVAYYTGDITIPASFEYQDATYTVIGVGDYAFYKSGVSSISFTTPSNVTYLGYRAMYNCTAITELTLPEGLTEVGDQAIRQCTSLKTFTLPETVVSLGGYMCYDNTALEKIVIPESVTTLGKYAYYGCSGATELTISPNITDWGSHAFYKCDALTSVEIPEGITEVGEYAFGNCAELVSISIPDEVTALGAHTFAACPKLESCVLPESMTEVDGYLFYNCPSLAEVTIGSKVESFGASVFAGCPALVAIYSLNPTPPSAPSSTFADTTVKTGTTDKETCVLYIPVGSYDDYSTADEWKDFLNIVEMTEFSIETLAATEVTDSSATLNGSITAAYNDPIIEKGFEYWTGSEEAQKAVVEGDEMTATVTGLTYGTEYTYRAYAVMESGTTEYGEEQTFTTETPTGINGIRISIDDENVEGIYSTSGQKLNTTMKGVNIIRYADGTVKKIYVK